MRIFISLYCLLLFSCHKKLASFNPSQTERFGKQSNIIDPKTNNFAIIEKIKPEKSEIPEIKIFESEPLKKEPPTVLKKTYRVLKGLKVKSVELKPIVDSKTTIKKKHKRNRLFNDSVKIGLSFLLIAVILALFSLSQLSLLFGVTSIIFLFIGLKKYYRRQRIRKLFT